MKDETQDLIPAELRRKTVERLARGLADGSIRTNWQFVETRSDEGRNSFADLWTRLTMGLRKWLKDIEKGIPTSELEEQIFNDYLFLNSVGGTLETYSAPKLEKDVDNLSSRMDSTNTLLLDVLKAMRKMQDDLDFMRGVFDNLGKS